MGFCGDEAVPLEQLSCKANGLKYDFVVAYENVFKPSEEHILVADLVEISLDK